MSGFSNPRRQQVRRLGRAAAIAVGGLAATVGAVAAALAGLWAIAVGLLLVAAGPRSPCASLGAAGGPQRCRRAVRVPQRALSILEREGWRIRHSERWRGRSDIDHVAISPAAIAFAIETKTLPSNRDTSKTSATKPPGFGSDAAAGARAARFRFSASRAPTADFDGLVVSLDELLPALRAAAGTTSRPDFLAPAPPTACR